jgi:hypothetical protein
MLAYPCQQRGRVPQGGPFSHSAIGSFGQLANYITQLTTANGQLHWSLRLSEGRDEGWTRHQENIAKPPLMERTGWSLTSQCCGVSDHRLRLIHTHTLRRGQHSPLLQFFRGMNVLGSNAFECFDKSCYCRVRCDLLR